MSSGSASAKEHAVPENIQVGMMGQYGQVRAIGLRPQAALVLGIDHEEGALIVETVDMEGKRILRRQVGYAQTLTANCWSPLPAAGA